MLCFISLVIIIPFIVAYFISNYFLYSKNHSIDEAYSLFKDKYFNVDYINSINKEEYQITNLRGEKLFGELWHAKNNSEKLVIICHGFTWNRVASYKYAKMFLDRNYDVLLYDHTHCGKSDGKYTTLGFRESEDLSYIIKHLRLNRPQYKLIGCHGESMGAVTVLKNMAINNNVDFVIADCPFSSFYNLLKYKLKTYYLPAFPLIPLISLMCRRTGFGIEDLDIVKDIKANDNITNIPVLLIHGTGDTYIPFENSEKIKSAKNSNVQIYLCENAAHAESFTKDPTRYEEEINSFLNIILSL